MTSPIAPIAFLTITAIIREGWILDGFNLEVTFSYESESLSKSTFFEGREWTRLGSPAWDEIQALAREVAGILHLDHGCTVRLQKPIWGEAAA